MKRLLTPLRIAGGAACVLLVLLGVPLGGRALTPADGSASAESFLFRVTVGDRTAALASDGAEAALGDRPAAGARLAAGSAGSEKVGASERSASADDAGGRTPVATTGPVSIVGLLALDRADGSVSATVSRSGASSAVVVALGPARLLGGLAMVGGSTSETRTRVTRDGAETTRVVEIDGIRLLPLGELLRAIGAGELDLGCESVERIGALIGVPATGACGDLSAATSGIGAAVEALSSAPDGLAAARDALEAQRDALEGEIDAAQEAIAGLEAERQALGDARAAIEAEREGLESDRDGLQSQRSSLVDDAGDHTRASVEADHATVAALCEGLGAVEALACRATALVTTLPDLAASYGVALPATFDDARAAMLLAIDDVLEIFDRIDVVDGLLDANAAAIEEADDRLAQNAVETADLDATIDAARADLGALEDALAGVLDGLDDILGGIALIGSEPGDVRATCDATAGALGTTAGLVPGLRPSFEPVETALRAACASLRQKLDAVMNMPLLSLDAVRISLRGTAGDGTADVSVAGTVGRVTVGGLAPLGVDLALVSGEVPAVRDAVGSLLAQVSAAIGLEIPTPTFEFLAVEKATGDGDGGAKTAHASVTALRVHFPTGTIVRPAAPPLGLLSPGGPAAASMRTAGAATAPDVTLDLGVFAASARFRAAATPVAPDDATGSTPDAAAPDAASGGPSGAPGRGTLPVTGLAGPWTAVGLLALVVAAALRRALLR